MTSFVPTVASSGSAPACRSPACWSSRGRQRCRRPPISSGVSDAPWTGRRRWRSCSPSSRGQLLSFGLRTTSSQWTARPAADRGRAWPPGCSTRCWAGRPWPVSRRPCCRWAAARTTPPGMSVPRWGSRCSSSSPRIPGQTSRRDGMSRWWCRRSSPCRGRSASQSWAGDSPVTVEPCPTT